MVASRRDLLRTMGGAAAALAAPRLSAAQAFTATSISQAAQDARREVGLLGRRADNLLRLTVADGLERGGAAVRRFRADQGPLARDLAAIFNGRVSEDDWLLIAPTRDLDLVLTMRPLVIRLAPTLDEVEAALKEPLPQIAPLPGEGADDVVLAIVLAALGFPRRDQAVADRLKSNSALAAALSAAAAAVKTHRYGLAALEFERLMRVVVLPDNVATIAGPPGEAATRRLYQALVVRFVPFIGWSYFTALLLAAVYLNRDTTAPVLR
jgi:hypothetical protein